MRKCLAAFITLLAITALVFSFYYYQFVSVPVINNNQCVHYLIQDGMTNRQLANGLHQQGLVRHPKFFELISRVEGKSRHLQAGEYQFSPGATEQMILNNIASGDVVKHLITIIEGWTVQQMLTAIKNDPDIVHTLNETTLKTLAQQLDIKQNNPEGWFFPDTYQFVRGTTDKDILERAYHRMQAELDSQWQQRAPNLGYHDAYQALIVASMIVKEAKVASERPQIAGVILQRLKKRMRLQIDPTVIYGMGSAYTGKITRRDLRKKTPYNTYVHYGLPPTPIALPGKASLHAALHPDMTQALYFVARGDGSHVFSDNLKAQNQAVKRYILNKPNSTP